MLIATSLLLITFILIGDLFLRLFGFQFIGLEKLGVSILIGLLLQYIVFLITGSLSVSLNILMLGAAITPIYWVVRKCKIDWIEISRVKNFAFIFLGVFAGFKAANATLGEFDPRGIWYLHAKLFFWNDQLSSVLKQSSSVMAYSHPDYPNLVPMLAASLSRRFGEWSEQAPVFSIFVLWLAGNAILFRYLKLNFYSLLLFLIFNFLHAPLLWNGYVDGILYFFVGLSSFAFLDWLKIRTRESALKLVLILATVTLLKNEGMVVLLAFGLGGICAFLKFDSTQLKRFEKISFFLMLIPIGIWTLQKVRWGIHSEYSFTSPEALSRAWHRLFETNEFRYLFLSVWYYSFARAVFILILLAAVFMKWAKIDFRRLEIWFPFGVGTLYSIGVFMTYWFTPWDLVWQLQTSLDRIILSYLVLILLAWAQMIQAIENQTSTTAISD